MTSHESKLKASFSVYCACVCWSLILSVMTGFACITFVLVYVTAPAHLTCHHNHPRIDPWTTEGRIGSPRPAEGAGRTATESQSWTAESGSGVGATGAGTETERRNGEGAKRATEEEWRTGKFVASAFSANSCKHFSAKDLRMQRVRYGLNFLIRLVREVGIIRAFILNSISKSFSQ